MFGTGITVWQPAVYGTGGFTPGSLYTAGQLGLWYDASDMATLYQDSAGATPVTAVTQPVGKQLDKSGRGNHATQATASARPLLSARVNLLTKTEQFDDAAWTKTAVTVAANGAADSLGATTLDKIIETVVAGAHFVFQATGSALSTIRLEAKASERSLLSVADNAGTTGALFDLSNGTFTTFGAATAVITVLGGGLYSCVATFNPANTLIIGVANAGGTLLPSYTGDGVSGLFVGRVHVEYGSTATRYQRVNTATDYDTVGFPLFLTYDGVNDGMSTASFAAGTLGADMDCFIAVRRNSAANVVLAYGQSSNEFFGAAESGSIQGLSVNAGTPTYFVDGISVTATRDALHTALTVGSWCILEARNLNLSTWTVFKVGAYGGTYSLNGDAAQIVLLPAGDATSRQKIRTYLGASSSTLESLFANGKRGFYFSANGAQTLYQNTAETTPVTTSGQTLARSTDRSPNNTKFNWATSTAVVDAFGLWAARLNGSSSIATSVAALNFAGATKATAIFAVRQRTYDSTPVVLMEHAAPPFDGTGGIAAYGNNTAPAGGFGGGAGDASTNYIINNSTLGAANERVVIVQLNYDSTAPVNANKLTVQINGAAASQITLADVGTATSTMFRSGSVWLGARGSGGLFANIDLFAALYIDRALTVGETANAYASLAAQCKPSRDITSGFWDSVAPVLRANYYETSAFAQTVFTTSETLLELFAYNDMYNNFPAYANLGVFVNGVYNQTVFATGYGATRHMVTLPAGVKTVAIVNGLQSKPIASIIGMFLGAVRSVKAITLVSPVTSNRLLIYGDSISVGANCTNPQTDSWAMKVRAANLPNSTMLDAWGYRSLWEDAVNATARTAFVARWAALNPAKIWLAIGTNDYGLDKWTAALFGTAYAATLDALHTALPSATIYCQTPILRGSDLANGSGSTLADYRAQIATAQSTRSSYAVLVDGTAFMTTASLSDGVHPTDAGNALYATAVRSVLGI